MLQVSVANNNRGTESPSRYDRDLPVLVFFLLSYTTIFFHLATYSRHYTPWIWLTLTSASPTANILLSLLLISLIIIILLGLRFLAAIHSFFLCVAFHEVARGQIAAASAVAQDVIVLWVCAVAAALNVAPALRSVPVARVHIVVAERDRVRGRRRRRGRHVTHERGVRVRAVVVVVAVAAVCRVLGRRQAQRATLGHDAATRRAHAALRDHLDVHGHERVRDEPVRVGQNRRDRRVRRHGERPRAVSMQKQLHHLLLLERLHASIANH